jgi:aerobic carbon-monoxide dehydrogenase large subunit
MLASRELPTGAERRREDYQLITGHGYYVDDLRPPANRPAALHMVVARSLYAHAEIQHISLDQVRALPGVIAAFEAGELVSSMPTMDTMTIPHNLRKPPRHPLALQRARYVGDPLAVVLAETLPLALDALDLVDVNYLPLPAVSDPEAALAPDAPLLYEELGTNVVFNTQTSGGDIAAAFAQAEHHIRLRLINQRIAASSMEPRACMFDFDAATGELTAWVSSQAIFSTRETLARFLGIDRSKIRVINAEVGGGFGTKTGFVGEEIVAAALALRFARPVKWIESRSENLSSQTHGRGQINYIEAAAQSDGRLLGLKLYSIGDLGAFLSSSTSMVPNGTAALLNGPYRIQAIQTQVIGALTNKVPTAAYRGAGRPEAAYILERVMDRLAHTLNIDPVEIRRCNLIPPDAFPYKTLSGGEYDSGNYEVALNRAVELADYSAWRAKQLAQRQQNSSTLLGIGLAAFNAVSGGAMGPLQMPQEAATVRIRRDGTILVQSGVASNGQGHFTAFAQIVASAFHLPATQVEVQMNDTVLPAFGIGTFGSRTTQISGSAVALAAAAVREKALQVAAQHLEAAVADLEIKDGSISVRGVPARLITLGELARMVEEQPELIEHERPNRVNEAPIEGLAAWRDFRPSNATFSSGTHLAVVEVDTETGEIAILRYVAVDDCGTILNPYLADAQVHGATAQGIGQALYEEVLYDDRGELLSSTLMDYTMPNAGQIPDIVTDFVETPSPLNPLGAKGIGESGCIGAPPAIVNAVLDALSPLGIQTIDMPLKPERVWATIQAARNRTLPETEPVLPAIFTTEQAIQEHGTSEFA